jgi:hypothetical protein
LLNCVTQAQHRSAHQATSSRTNKFIRWMQGHGRDPRNSWAMRVMNLLSRLWTRREKVEAFNSSHLQVRHPITLFHQPSVGDQEGWSLQGFSKGDGHGNLQATPQRHSGSDPNFDRFLSARRKPQVDVKDLTSKTCFLLATCGLLHPDDLACPDVSQCKLNGEELEPTVVFPKGH